MLTISVNVNLGLNEETYSLLSALLGHKECKCAARVAQEAQVGHMPAPMADKEEVQESAQPVPEPAKTYSEEDVREAMHRTRLRIEGDDYRENTDGERYKTFHRKLTNEFKKLSAFLGAEKPSLLDADKREAFISACDGLEASEDGQIVSPQIF